MKTIALMAAVLVMTAPGVMAVGKKAAKVDVEPESLTSFMGASLLATTNAQGQLAKLEVMTSPSSRYQVLTNGMDSLTLKNLAKLKDNPVDFKGEIAQVSNVLCVKVSGSIKDMTPSLSGVSLGVQKDLNGKVVAVTVKAGKFDYRLSLAGLEPDFLDGLSKFNGKLVDIEGEIQHSKESVVLTGTIKESRGGKKTEKKSAKKGK